MKSLLEYIEDVQDSAVNGLVEDVFIITGEEEYEDWGEESELCEIAYPGNIGAMEFVKFHRTASVEQKALMQQHLKDKKHKQALDLLHKVTGVRLKESIFEEKKVNLNKPFLTPGGPKKRAVYVKNDKGNVVKVNFGDPNLSIKRDDPERRKSFRARHSCDNAGPKWKARYWSCKYWSSTPVSKLD